MSNNQLFSKSFNAAGTIVANSIVKVGANDYDVLQAAAGTDLVFGVSTEVGAVSGERIDVVLEGIVDVKLGATVARGQLVMSDASGFGILAAAAGGSNVNVIGRAMVSGVVGDIVPVLLSIGSFQG